MAQRDSRQLEPPHLIRLDRFDAELSALLAGGGFVAPFANGPRPSPSDRHDASRLGWTAPGDADTVEAFIARWRDRLAQVAPREGATQ